MAGHTVPDAATVPAVSIGMPTYNAAATIAASIESLLAQTLADFELIVSDNASTDDTAAIVAGYAGRDARVRLIRQPENIGANRNYSAVFRAARAPYFKWASSNDLCGPAFLAVCVAALQAQPDAVLAAPRTRLFSESPDDAVDYPDDIALTDAEPVARLRALLESLRLNNAMNGVIRAEALRRTRLIEPYYQADVVLAAQLALLGRFVLLPERLFFRRWTETSATSLADAERWARHHHPRPDARALFQGSKRQTGWLRLPMTAGLTLRERFGCLNLVAHHIYWERAVIGEDLRQAVSYARRNHRRT